MGPPYSYSTTIASGLTDSFTVPFPYLEKQHVHVKIDDVTVDDLTLTWADSGTLKLVSKPAAGSTVKVYRDTPKDVSEVVFETPSILTAESLNRACLQLLYISQEAFDLGLSTQAELDTITSYINSALQTVADAVEYIQGAVEASAYPIATDPQAIAGTSTNTLLTPHGGAILVEDRITESKPVQPVVSFVFDMMRRALKMVGWNADEPGGVVSYVLSASAAKGDTTITITGTQPTENSLLVLKGTDNEYYFLAASDVDGGVVLLSEPLPVAVTLGANCWNAMNNESHLNEYGWRALADEFLRTNHIAVREVYQGLSPAAVGTADIYDSTAVSPTNPGSISCPAYAIQPVAANDGGKWTFALAKPGMYQVSVAVNTAGADDCHLRIYYDGVGTYDWALDPTAFAKLYEFTFNVVDPASIEVRLFRITSSTQVFITSYLSVREVLGPQFGGVAQGTIGVFGDSWVAISSDYPDHDPEPGHFGFIDRLRERNPHATFVNLGHGGDGSPQLLARMADLVGVNPPFTKAIMVCGTNDYFADRTAKAYGQPLARIRAACVDKGIPIISFTSSCGSPSNAARFDRSRTYIRDAQFWDYRPQEYTAPVGTRTRTVYTSGSGIYTAPANCKYIVGRMIGGGGGGAGSGTTPGAAGAGGSTTFGTFSATGGAAGTQSTSGGTGGGAAGSPSVAQAGGQGQGAAQAVSTPGGSGGIGRYGGAGWGGPAGSAGRAASTGSGAGGGGGGSGASVALTGAGGGAGGYAEFIILNPTSYSFSVGTGGTAGTAGTSGVAGGAGAGGSIIIDEYYR